MAPRLRRLDVPVQGGLDIGDILRGLTEFGRLDEPFAAGRRYREEDAWDWSSCESQHGRAADRCGVVRISTLRNRRGPTAESAALAAPQPDDSRLPRMSRRVVGRPTPPGPCVTSAPHWRWAVFLADVKGTLPITRLGVG